MVSPVNERRLSDVLVSVLGVVPAAAPLPEENEAPCLLLLLLFSSDLSPTVHRQARIKLGNQAKSHDERNVPILLLLARAVPILTLTSVVNFRLPSDVVAAAASGEVVDVAAALVIEGVEDDDDDCWKSKLPFLPALT